MGARKQPEADQRRAVVSTPPVTSAGASSPCPGAPACGCHATPAAYMSASRKLCNSLLGGNACRLAIMHKRGHDRQLAASHRSIQVCDDLHKDQDRGSASYL